jgi:hypothetical protein
MEQVKELLQKLERLSNVRKADEPRGIHTLRSNWLAFLRSAVEITDLFRKDDPKEILVVGVDYEEVMLEIAKSVRKLCFPDLDNFLQANVTNNGVKSSIALKRDGMYVRRLS